MYIVRENRFKTPTVMYWSDGGNGGGQMWEIGHCSDCNNNNNNNVVIIFWCDENTGCFYVIGKLISYKLLVDLIGYLLCTLNKKRNIRFYTDFHQKSYYNIFLTKL